MSSIGDGGAHIRIGGAQHSDSADSISPTVPQEVRDHLPKKVVRKQLSLGGLFKGIAKFLGIAGAGAGIAFLLTMGSPVLGVALIGGIGICVAMAWRGRVKGSEGSGNSSAEQIHNKMTNAFNASNLKEGLTGSGDAEAAERERERSEAKRKSDVLKVKLTRRQGVEELELALGGSKVQAGTGGANATVSVLSSTSGASQLEGGRGETGANELLLAEVDESAVTNLGGGGSDLVSLEEGGEGDRDVVTQGVSGSGVDAKAGGNHQSVKDFSGEMDIVNGRIVIVNTALLENSELPPDNFVQSLRTEINEKKEAALEAAGDDSVAIAAINTQFDAAIAHLEAFDGALNASKMAKGDEIVEGFKDLVKGGGGGKIQRGLRSLNPIAGGYQKELNGITANIRNGTDQGGAI
ncbi:MAG: hypothetical protein ACI8RA_000718 [Chlamydiales bacterium]|jgi:hypothetical protein